MRDDAYAKHVAVERTTKLIERSATPLARLEAPRGAGRQRCVETGDAQIRIRRRRADALHVDEPRRRVALAHAERRAQFGRQHAGPLRRQLRFVLAALVVHVAVRRQVGRFALVFEEGIVQHLRERKESKQTQKAARNTRSVRFDSPRRQTHLVVDVHFAHFRLQFLAALEFELLRFFSFNVR